MNRTVGNDYDLLNVLPGKYRLQFKDETGCDTIVTPFYVVADKGLITIDTSHKIVTASKCSGVSGSIRQIKVIGGETYQWINTANNVTAGTTVDAINLAPGNYRLSVANSYGCSKNAPVITVPQAEFAAINVTGFTASNALCGENNGSIMLNTFDKDASLYTFQWADSTSGETIGTGISVYDLKAGGYELFATDNYGCKKQIFNTHIKGFPVPDINYSNLKIKNDECNNKTGSVSLLRINGLAGTVTYTWYDEDNQMAGNRIDLENAGEGTYVLKITDNGICTIQSKPFIITNTNSTLPVPLYDNLTIPRYSDATLSIRNPAPGEYQLSANTTGAPVLQQNSDGKFVIPKVDSDTDFYVRRISGSCLSPVAKVTIKVVDKSYFTIPNAFTPNGDGMNDLLPVKVIGYIELAYFRVYNQWGEKVYETHRLNEGWDGIRKGILQNTGVFVWVAEGKDISGRVIRDKGSVVLIR